MKFHKSPGLEGRLFIEAEAAEWLSATAPRNGIGRVDTTNQTEKFDEHLQIKRIIYAGEVRSLEKQIDHLKFNIAYIK